MSHGGRNNNTSSGAMPSNSNVGGYSVNEFSYGGPHAGVSIDSYYSPSITSPNESYAIGTVEAHFGIFGGSYTYSRNPGTGVVAETSTFSILGQWSEIRNYGEKLKNYEKLRWQFTKYT